MGWQPGDPLYLDPDTLEDLGEPSLPYVRPMWELVNDLLWATEGDEQWEYFGTAYRWTPTPGWAHFPWMAPVAKRRTKPGKRRLTRWIH